MNNSIFGKFVENVRKYRNIKLAAAEERRNYLVLEPSYYSTTFFPENSLPI